MTRQLLILCVLLLSVLGQPARADLFEYVARPEPEFLWHLRSAKAHSLGTVYDLHVVSQVWQGIRWEHQVQVYQPKDVQPRETMLVWNQGGTASEKSVNFGFELAVKTGSPVAFVFGIPNQPLFDGRKEDDLISETFLRYLSTRDENWPLLFPMVKSLVKSMDALQEFAAREWQAEVKHFVVSGASKRGWTSWLTGAADPRVKAIAPLVIDTLNMRAQIPHQKASLGAYSEQIADYTSKGLVPIPETPEADRLWSMVDPWVYRDRLTLPKFLINGNNDAYWTVDALNLYWDDLRGDKWVTYVPNAGHNLQQKRPDGSGDLSRTVNALCAFARSQIEGRPLPKIEWKHSDAGSRLRLAITSDRPANAARGWVVQSPTRDFRMSPWTEIESTHGGSAATIEIDRPVGGWIALYGELEFTEDGLTYQLSTQIRVLNAK